jgi:hypothetical protein
MNYHLGKSVAFADSRVAATKIFEHSHSFIFLAVLYTSCAENSVHRLATKIGVKPSV